MKKLVNFTNITDLTEHAREQLLKLVVYKGVVYDITDFLYEHPGGAEVIKPFLNHSIDDIIFNP